MASLKSRLMVFLLFGFVGTIGFLVDTLVLYMLKGLIGLYYGRVCSFAVAVLCTWILNKKFTFKANSSGLSVRRELIFYSMLMLIGGAANYIVFVLATTSSDFVYQHPILGVAFGSIAGMLINLTSTRFLVFNKVN